jgi:hypothetical protein
VVASKGARRKEAKKRIATDVRETAKKGGRTAAPTPPAGRQPVSRMATLPRTQRTSAVILTLNEGAKTTYAEVITTARRSIPFTEIGVKSVGMRKATTGAIIIKVPGDKGREKTLQLATHLSKMLDPTR